MLTQLTQLMPGSEVSQGSAPQLAQEAGILAAGSEMSSQPSAEGAARSYMWPLPCKAGAASGPQGAPPLRLSEAM